VRSGPEWVREVEEGDGCTVDWVQQLEWPERLDQSIKPKSIKALFIKNILTGIH
jgi:hypothetical protein